MLIVLTSPFITTGSSPNGAQAEYVVAPSVGALLIPDSWSFEEASQLSAGSFTACQMLYYALPLPMPPFSTSTPNPQPQTDVLIWGGSSSVGQAAVQLAHLSGLRVISTSSPRNFSLVKSLGADIVLPHSDPETISKIRALTGNKLKYALDTISEGSTPQQVADCIGDEGGVVSTALLYDSPRKDVEVRFVLAGMLMGIVSTVHSPVYLSTIANIEFFLPVRRTWRFHSSAKLIQNNTSSQRKHPSSSPTCSPKDSTNPGVSESCQKALQA